MKIMKIKSRHYLKGSDARKVIASLEQFLDDPSPLRAASLEMAITDEGIDLIFVNGRPLIMLLDGQPFFTVLGAIELGPQRGWW